MSFGCLTRSFLLFGRSTVRLPAWSARATAYVLQHADPAMTQSKYMARGRVYRTGRPRSGVNPPGDSGGFIS
ncbi:hypothetical protein C5E43_26815 [Nocardia cyriacigeorgica]|nr:hypothetical protein C5E43_26815 [Nocardia cyriacigeorgica]